MLNIRQANSSESKVFLQEKKTPVKEVFVLVHTLISWDVYSEGRCLKSKILSDAIRL